MITGVLLVCLLGTTDCTAQASPTFFDTIEQCENTNRAIYDRVNKDPESNFFILDTACVGWGEKA